MSEILFSQIGFSHLILQSAVIVVMTGHFICGKNFFKKCIESILRIAAVFQQLCMFKRNVKLKQCWLISTGLVVVITNRLPILHFSLHMMEITLRIRYQISKFYGFSVFSNGNISRIFLFHLLFLNEMYSKCYVSVLGHSFIKLMFITPTFAGKAEIKVNVTLW